MPILMTYEDITHMHTDAIVNAANPSLLGGGGVDGAIHAAAGPQLKQACVKLGGCRTGEAKLTPGFDLDCKYIIHTVGPIWQDGRHGEAELLKSCYRNSLSLAAEKQCRSIAFPMISTGAYGYPREAAFDIACETIREFLRNHDMTVWLVFFRQERIFERDRYREALQSVLNAAERKRNRDQRCFAPCLDADEMPGESIDQEDDEDNWSDKAHEGIPLASLSSAKHSNWKRRSEFDEEYALKPFADLDVDGNKTGAYAAEPAGCSRAFSPSRRFAPPAPRAVHFDEDALDEELKHRLKLRDESFREMLFRLIDERGMTDAECYTRANQDRKLFSKIRNSKDYHPKKQTVLSFAVALRLNLEQTRELLMKAGLALIPDHTGDVIVSFYIDHGVYDIFRINESLLEYDQYQLGTMST